MEEIFYAALKVAGIIVAVWCIAHLIEAIFWNKE